MGGGGDEALITIENYTLAPKIKQRTSNGQSRPFLGLHRLLAVGAGLGKANSVTTRVGQTIPSGPSLLVW